MTIHLQHIANNTDAPHVRLVADRLVADDLWRYELGRTEQNTQRGVSRQSLGQAKVDNLDLGMSSRIFVNCVIVDNSNISVYLMTVAILAHDILWLQVQMHH